MKKKSAVLAVLAMILLLLSVPFSVGAEEKTGSGKLIVNDELSEFNLRKPEPDHYTLEYFFKNSIYSIPTAPKNVHVGHEYEIENSMLWKTDTNTHQNNYEHLIKARIDFVSGDSRLDGLLHFVLDNQGDINLEANTGAIMALDPCEAEFLITMESDTYACQNKATLKVVSFEDNPPFEIPVDTLLLRMPIGTELNFYDFNSRLLDAYFPEELRSELHWIIRDYWDWAIYSAVEVYDIDQVRAISEGVAQGTYQFAFGPMYVDYPIRIEVLPYEINGPISMREGKEYQYKVAGAEDRHFTWSMSGTGAVIDPETGVLKVDGKISEPHYISISAVPENSRNATMMYVKLTGGEYTGEPIYLAGNTKLSEFDFRRKTERKILSAVEEVFEPAVWYVNLPLNVEGNISFLHPLYFDFTADDYKMDKSGKLVCPIKYAVEFVSGEEDLKDSLSFTTTQDDDGQSINIRLKYKDITSTGEAVFRITAESSRFYSQRDYTLRVVDFNNDPPFVIPDVPVVIPVSIGGKIGPDLWEFYKVSEEQYEEMKKYNLIRDYLSRRMKSMEEARDRIIQGFFAEQIAQRIVADGRKEIFELDVSNPNKSNPLEELPAIELDEENLFFTPAEPCTLDVVMPMAYENLEFDVKCRIVFARESINGPSRLMPGEIGQYAVSDSNKKYTWSIMGNGAEIDPASGVVTVSEDAVPGTLLMITATPEDGGQELSVNLRLGGFGFSSASVSMEETNGFTYPMLIGNDWQRGLENGDKEIRTSVAEDSDGLINRETVRIEDSKVFVHDELSARAAYQENAAEGEDFQTQEIIIDGALGLLQTWKATTEDGLNAYCGRIRYLRNNQSLTLDFVAGRKDAGINDVRPITMDYLQELASGLRYSAPEGTVQLADAKLQLFAENDVIPVIKPGKSLRMTASFANSEKINAEKNNNGIIWSLVDAATGEETEAAVISKDGVITAAKKLDRAYTLRVLAKSEWFQTTAEKEIGVYPQVTKIEAEPKDVFLYEGSDKTESIQVLLTPDSIPTTGIAWKPQKEGIVEIVSGEDGTAVFRSRASGKTAVTVTEPGGKKTSVNVQVVTAVEDVELSISGKQVPGGTVTVKETLLPKNAGNKNVEWSIDVGDDIAVISKGKIKIAKTAPLGTVITVTCKSLGAPEPVVRTISFEVTE